MTLFFAIGLILVLLVVYCLLIFALYHGSCSGSICSSLYNVGVNPTGLALCCGKLYVANNNNPQISGSDSVTVIDLATNLPLVTIHHNSFNQPYTITPSRCCDSLYVSNSGGSEVSRISTKTNSVTDVLTGFDGPSGVAIYQDRYLFVNNYGATPGVGSGNGTTVSVYDLQTSSIVKTIETDLAPAALVIRGNQVVVVNYVDGNPKTGTLQVINADTKAIVGDTVTGLSGPFDVVIGKCGKKAYVANFGSNNFFPYGETVSIVDLVNRKIVWNVSTGIQPSGLALSTCCTKLYVTNYNTLYSDDAFSQLVPGQGTVSVIDLCSCPPKLTCPTFKVGQSPGNIIVCNGFAFVSNYTSNTVTRFSVY